MSDNPSSPLLGSSDRPTSDHSHRDEDLENTPLLSRPDSAPRYDGDEYTEQRQSSPAARSLRSLQNGHGSPKSTKGKRRWPTIIAITFLGLIAVAIILGAFFAPAVVEEYAKEALVIEPTNLSIDSFTATGVTARIQANFRMDASRVKNKDVRNIGRFGTWIARKVETKETKVEVYLPELGGILIGTAAVPRVVVDIRNGYTTGIDFLTNLEPGNIEDLRQVANDWLDGHLGSVRVLSKANVGIKSGLFSLGTQSISESFQFEGNDLPTIPEYNITRLNFREVPISLTGRRGMAAEVSLSLINDYPVKFTIPPLGFDILVPNCGDDDPYIRLADATTAPINIEPKSEVNVDVGGIVRELPKTLVDTCPNSHSSPLDTLLGQYIKGNDTTIFVRGAEAPDDQTPEWITKIISSVTVPVPFPGKTFDNLIKNFSLTDTHFSLPDPSAEPGSDEENPQISGKIVVIAGLPKEMNFGINVTGVRATAQVYYKGKKLGNLNLRHWQDAESKRIEPHDGGDDASLKITSQVKNAPLQVTDDNVFTDVLQAIIFGGSGVNLKIEALVKVKVDTVLGELVIKDLPAEGNIPDPLPLFSSSIDRTEADEIVAISTGSDFSALQPKVSDLKILSTTQTSLDFEALVNFTNPTEYTAHIPFINIHVLNNGSILGDATARNINVVKGNNTNVLVQATWDPTKRGDGNARKIGRDLLSQYISGYNTTLTFQTHKDSIPYQPKLGKALSKFKIEIPTPRLGAPGDGKGIDGHDKPQFLDDATFHLFSSTADFTLHSPLQHSTIYIERINATALYNHTEPIGKINYDLPFKVPPGVSKSPRLPVDWSLDSVGYEEIRKALGGTLKLDAKGIVKVRLGQWTETVWYVGSGIGASVRW
ncbi:hypothetical protein LSUE1_G003340 [Lachnellula suecica]|uniref:Pre-rRNA processing protein n=1 Tax=Lachnellula suecica TaxID=602035 RepID=A0A8T9C0V7_9HELO|nr:hypothetical protein LSUE1_G003340 [Lachnellula suecica]